MRAIVLTAILAGLTGTACRHYVYAPAPHPIHTWGWWYYPDAYCYYSPGTHRYWYRSPAGIWIESDAAPVGVSLSSHVDVDFNGADPWRRHDVHIQLHPGRILAPHNVIKALPKPHEILPIPKKLPIPSLPNPFKKRR